MPWLSWQEEGGPRQLELGNTTRLGRRDGNDIVMADPLVSGFHARIVREGETVIFVDNQSRNGSLINGRTQVRATLRDGDVIRIGNVDFIFHSGPVPDVAEARPAAAAIPVEIDTIATISLAAGDLAASDAEPQTIARRLQVAYDVSRATAATLQLPALLERVLDALLGTFNNVGRAVILLADPGTGDVATAASRGQTTAPSRPIEISHTAVDLALRRREAVLCLDARKDGGYAEAQSVVAYGIRSIMVAPLQFQGELLGAIYVDSRTAAAQFTQADLELLVTAAGSVAACIANARMHEQVVASQRMAAVGQTVAGIAHCVKNVLQSIKAGSFLLNKEVPQLESEPVERAWKIVDRGTTFLEELVLDMLAYAKEREPEYQATDLNALCGDLCELCASRARTNKVAIVAAPDETLAEVQVDPMGLRRCLLNLIMNAVDACEKSGGSVTVRTRAPDDAGFVRISVEDTGCGMSEETRAKLFTMFFSTKGGKGTGLGLAVSQKIVQEHGGRIEVQSEEGKGTTFILALPVAPPDSAAESPAKAYA